MTRGNELTDENPLLQVTCGFIVSAEATLTNIAVNVNFNPKDNSLWPVDGFVIPKKAIIKFKKIGWLV